MSVKMEEDNEGPREGGSWSCLICQRVGGVNCNSSKRRASSRRRKDAEEISDSEKTEIMIEFCKKLEVPKDATSELFKNKVKAPPVCLTCLSAIKIAVEKGRESEAVEVQVRDLQGKLLEQLYQLQNLMGQYNLEIQKIENLMKNSMAASTGGDADDYGLVWAFRQHIHEVVKDLNMYRANLSSKLTGPPRRATSIGGNEQNCKKEFEKDSDSSGDDSNVGLEELEYTEVDKGSDKEWSPDDGGGDGGSDHDNDNGDMNLEGFISCTDYETDLEEKELPQTSRKSAGKQRKRKRKSISNSNSSRITKSNLILNEIEARIQFPKDIGYIKKYFILRARQDEMNESESLGSAQSEEAEMEPVKYPIKHNKETETFSIGEVEIIFEEKHRTVKCTSCDFQTQLPASVKMTRFTASQLEKHISFHIHHVHMGAFNCRICSREYPNRQRYVAHMKRAHFGVVHCKICGKPLKCSEQLPDHEWTHLSEEEKIQRKEEGGRVPWRFWEANMPTDSNRVTCEICGKQYSKASINEHRKLHTADRGDTLMCPMCGKRFRKSYYNFYHKLFVCPLPGTESAEGMTEPGQQYKISCIYCPKKIKGAGSMQRHMKRFHSEESGERGSLCPICGKGYKCQSDLQMHMNIHQEERLWKCRFLCGRDFNVKRNCARHEKACKLGPLSEGQ